MSDMIEMWAALERYQTYADKAGHGDTWRRMTTERTADAAKWAAEKAWAAGVAAGGAAWAKVEDAAFVAARAARDAASATARAAAKLGSACRFAQRAIDTIKEARIASRPEAKGCARYSVSDADVEYSVQVADMLIQELDKEGGR